MFRPIFILTFAALAAATSAVAVPTSSTYSKHPESTSRQLSQLAQVAAKFRKRAACTVADQCSFLDQFKWKNNKRWVVAHDYANGQPFDSWWSKHRVFFDKQKKKMRLSITNEARHGRPYASGHLKSKKWHGYGCYEVRMKPPNQEGLITTFFSYTGKYDHAPGKAKAHNEVDVEFVYKKNLNKMALQANYFTNGKGGNEHIIPLNFNPTKHMHNYGFKWTSSGVEWYVDGKKVYTATKNTPKIWQGPHKIMMNLWPVSSAASGWGGNYMWKGTRTAVYKAVRFTRGEDCKIQNKF